MREDGTIERFESAERAIAAGFRTLLTDREASALEALPLSQRHAALAAMRTDPTWRPTAHARRTKKSRGAKRRQQRRVRMALAKERG